MTVRQGFEQFGSSNDHNVWAMDNFLYLGVSQVALLSYLPCRLWGTEIRSC